MRRVSAICSKSRARSNRILYSRLTDNEAGSSSYNIDLPDGGEALIVGNVLQQSGHTENPTMVSFAAESSQGAEDHLDVAHNTFYNMWLNGVFVDNHGSSPAILVNNILAGAPAMVLRGPGEPAGNVIGPPDPQGPSRLRLRIDHGFNGNRRGYTVAAIRALRRYARFRI